MRFGWQKGSGRSRWSTRCAQVAVALAAFACMTAFAGSAAAKDVESDLERDARLARRGAGLRVGGWLVGSPDGSSEVASSSTPFFGGYFQKGLDRHLAWVNNVGLWKRTQTFESSGGLTGGTVVEKVDAYVVPLFTAIKFHPLTGPEKPVQPFLDGGAGFAIGIETRSTEEGGSLVGSGSGTTTNVGFGLQVGTGVDWWLNHMFGLTTQVRYQWVRFTADVADQNTFDGIAFDAGLTYRFQY